MPGTPAGYSVLSPFPGNVTEWTVVSSDGRMAAGMLFTLLTRPNVQTEIFHARGLLPGERYHFRNQEMKHNVKDFGSMINTQALIHVKPDSMVHNMIAKRVKMDGETEDVWMYGDTLNEAGGTCRPGLQRYGILRRRTPQPGFCVQDVYHGGGMTV